MKHKTNDEVVKWWKLRFFFIRSHQREKFRIYKTAAKMVYGDWE